jgi:signal transduction histidine kinase
MKVKYTVLFSFLLLPALLFTQITSDLSLAELEAQNLELQARGDALGLMKNIQNRAIKYLQFDPQKVAELAADAQQLSDSLQDPKLATYNLMLQSMAEVFYDSNATLLGLRNAGRKADSLKEDTLQAFALRMEGEVARMVRGVDSSFLPLEKSLMIYEQLGLQREVAELLSQIAKSYSIGTQFDSASLYYDRAIALADEIGSLSLPSFIGDKAISRYFSGNKRESWELIQQAQPIFLRQKDTAHWAISASNGLSILVEMEDFDEVLNQAPHIVEMAKLGGESRAVMDAYINMGVAFQEKQLFDSADFYLRKGLTETTRQKNRGKESIALGSLGINFKLQGKMDSSEFYLMKSLEKVEGFNYLAKEKFTTMSNLGEIRFQQERYREALNLLEPAQTFFTENKVVTNQSQANQLALAKTYHALGKHTKAYEYMASAYVQQDTILNREQVRAMTKLESEVQFEQERERTELAFEAERERANLIRTGLLIGLVLLGLVAFFIYRNYRNQRLSNLALAEKNDQIEAQRKQLAQLNDTKDRIFSIIGHDMRKPALAFRGIAKKVNYLLKNEDYGTLQALGESIEKDALSLNKLTDDLLSWALLQKNVMPYQPEHIAVMEVVEESMDIFRPLAERKSIHISANIPEEMILLADRNAIRTILRNLIDNAIKYTPEGGTISIESREENGQAALLVKDTGVGMASETLKEIFLLKKEKSSPGTEGEKGSGLGLHLVHELVKLNKGSIEVFSKIKEGTRFELAFPIVSL